MKSSKFKEDEKYMNIALGLAKKGLGKTNPNPCVGTVIVKNDKIIAKGFHKKAGLPHAEIIALRKAGKKANGAFFYVTLEPCNHFGRTPPCTDAIIKAGAKKVIIGTKDPNPINFGKGIKKLNRFGIKTRTGILEKECKKLNEVFTKYVTKKIPFVTIKVAQSLDGKIATNRGESRWITGASARRYVHKLRSQVDAILVGVNTVLKDDPLLTCRHFKSHHVTTSVRSEAEPPRRGQGRQPIKIIVDSELKTPMRARIFSKESPAPVIIATTKNAKKDRINKFKGKYTIIKTPSKNGNVDLKYLMEELAKRQISHVLVEGGGSVIASFLKEKLADKVLIFIAPKIIGGKDAPTSVEGEGIKKIDNAIQLKDVEFKKIGKDFLIEGYLNV